MLRNQAYNELDEIRAELAAYCEENGYDDRPDLARRLIDLGASFAWLKLNPDTAGTEMLQLDRIHIDAVLTACGIITFDGPPCAMVGDTKYITLTSMGVGEPHDCAARADDAWLQFMQQLLLFVGGANQVAWRQSPMLTGDTGKWRVSCRLARF